MANNNYFHSSNAITLSSSSRQLRARVQKKYDDSDESQEACAFRETQKLKFKNPGRFMQDFNPQRSGREMRKINRRIYSDHTKKNALYDPCGRLIADGRDLCDCLEANCPGCHFPCPKCDSEKCGQECRANRKWVYGEVEIEGGDQKYVFRPMERK